MTEKEIQSLLVRQREFFDSSATLPVAFRIDAFTHYKSIVDKKTWIDLPMRYQPYNSRLSEWLLRRFLK